MKIKSYLSCYGNNGIKRQSFDEVLQTNTGNKVVVSWKVLLSKNYSGRLAYCDHVVTRSFRRVFYSIDFDRGPGETAVINDKYWFSGC